MVLSQRTTKETKTHNNAILLPIRHAHHSRQIKTPNKNIQSNIQLKNNQTSQHSKKNTKINKTPTRRNTTQSNKLIHYSEK
jgi:hypothetical protein